MNQKEVHVKGCSKFQILDTDWNQIVIMTPLFFNIIRFYSVVLQRNANIPVMGISVVIAFGALFYLTVPQMIETDIYFIPKNGCPYEIYSAIPYFIEVQIFNMVLLIIVPLIGFGISYLIYKIIIKTKQKSTVRESASENRNLFKSIAIQSLFPFLSQLPGILLVFYTILFHQTNSYVDIAMTFIYHFAQGFCIFFSLYVIKDFKIMILKDLKLFKLSPLSNVSMVKTTTNDVHKVKFSHSRF